MSDLLKESIADAKAVRETALANAKTFLEENFAASMKEMFAEKLKEEMAEEATTDEGKIEEKLGSSNIGKDDSNIASKQHPTKPAPVANKNTTPAGKQEFDVKLEEEAAVEEGAEVTSEELDEILAELEGEVSEGESKESSEPESKDEVDEEISLDELLAELEAEEASPAPAPAPAAETPVAPVPAPAPAAPGQVPSPVAEAAEEDDVTSEEMAEALVAINEENETLKKQLSEALSTVKFMKGVLAETNLLNAKLLYTNKVFENASLNERQKQTIVESISKAKTLDEAKTIYDTLQSTVDGGKKVAPKSLSEALFENAPFVSRPRTNNNSNVDMLTERMKKLAGIKRSN